MMTTRILFFALATSFMLVSCSGTRQMASAGYEDDEIYYRKGDTFVTEVPAPSERPTNNAEIAEDDYYVPGQDIDVTNTYYGDAYTTNGFQNEFDLFANRPMWVMNWDPFLGWYFTYNFGCNQWNCPDAFIVHATLPGWGPSSWNSWNGRFWGDPFLRPMGATLWNTGYFWNGSGFGFGLGPWGNGYWADAPVPGQVNFGHRSPLAANSVFSSVYNDQLTSTDRIGKPFPNVDQPVSSDENAVRTPSRGRSNASRFPYVQTDRPSNNTDDRNVRRPAGQDDYFTPRPFNTPHPVEVKSPDVRKPASDNSSPGTGRRPSASPGGRDSERRPSSGFSSPSSGGSGRSGSGSSSPSPSRSGGGGGTTRRR
ncbi:MAG: hypothetical protein ACK54P_09075 [Bacteroidota bacterium]